jgi:hypothetical protein
LLELQKSPLQNSENNEQTYSSDSSGFDINKLNLDELNIQEQSSLQAQIEIPPK